MDHEDEIQETENDQWEYLDGSRASRPDDPEVPQPGFIGQAVTDIGKILMTPWTWFRKKPARNVPQRNRRNLPQNHRVSPPLSASRADRDSNGVPFKRQRVEPTTYGSDRNAMPPNVDFVDDERPRSPPSADAYMTEDEDDSDMEISGPSTSTGAGRGRTQIGQGKQNHAASSSVISNYTARRPPLAERTLLSIPPSPASATTPRRNSLLPLINAQKSGLRHPLMEHTKITVPPPSSTPQASRKRNIDAVDQDDAAATAAAPKLFSSFPKSTEEKAAGPALSRFNTFGKSADAVPVSKLAAPYYAIRRYQNLLNQGKESKIPTFAPMKPITLKPYMPVSQQQTSGPGRQSTKLDYRFVVPTVKTASVSGVQEFTFQASPNVPSGAVKQALEKFISSGGDRDSGSETSRQSSQSPSTRRCRKCGIGGLGPGDDQCGVCLQAGSSRTSGSADASPDRPSQKKKAATQQEVFDVDDETWKCSVCATENSESASSCKDCGKSKKSSEAPMKPLTAAKPDKAVASQAAPASTLTRPDDAPSRGGEPPSKRTNNEKSNNVVPTPTSSTNDGPKPATATAPPGFVDIWSKAGQAKTWSCPGCFCSNADTMDKCPACETLKPGTVAAKEPKSTPATAVIPSTLFGGLQPVTTDVAKPPAPVVNGGLSTGGFTFGAPLTAAKVAEPPKTLPTFSFGTPVSATTPAAPPPVFTGFGGLTAQTNGTSATTPAAPSIFAGLSNGTPSFGFIATSSAPSTVSFPSFGAPVTAAATTTAAPAGAPFGGFAANSITTTALPSVPSSTSFGAGMPTFGNAVSKPVVDFNFGQPSATAPPSFGFNSIAANPTINAFGMQNGSTPQAAAPGGLFGGAGFGAFGQQPMPNGQSATSFVPSGLPQPGTFGSSLVGTPGTMGTLGAMGSPRRILKGKRNLGRN